MVNRYQKKRMWHVLQVIITIIDNIIQRIHTLPAISEHTKQTIEEYLEEHHLFIELDEALFFDVKFIFLSHLLTLTKKQHPSSSFMLHGYSCPS
jgi:hypothetical protein